MNRSQDKNLNIVIHRIFEIYKNNDGFFEQTNPHSIKNSLKKESLITLFQILKSCSTEEIMHNIDKFTFCLSLFEFAGSVELKAEELS